MMRNRLTRKSVRVLAISILVGVIALCIPGVSFGSDGSTVARPMNAFAFGLLKHLPGQGNIVVSPYSADASLAAVGLGAEHTTAAQIKRVLHATSTAQWTQPFDPQNTHSESFVSTDGAVATPFMQRVARYRYAKGPDYQTIELPYLASDLSMLVVMPDHSAVAHFRRQFDVIQLKRVVTNLRTRAVDLHMPRFRLEYRTMLNPALAAMGMSSAFRAGIADFSGIGGTPGSLYLSLVVQAADLQVDEQGTVGAASTVSVINATSAPLLRHAITLRLNHPFLFFIRDNATGAVLFAGQVVNPA